MSDEILGQIIINAKFSGIAYMFIWGELSEESEGYRALSEVLFDYETVADPENAPSRDLTDPNVRRGVLECAMRFDDVRQACEKVISELS